MTEKQQRNSEISYKKNHFKTRFNVNPANHK